VYIEAANIAYRRLQDHPLESSYDGTGDEQ